MLYAVVDIETTGGHASANGITEIAINVHDDDKIVETFHSLINPLGVIPDYITALTGIDNAMVADAPTFNDIALQIFQILENKIFVAHNVNFDYSFIKHHLDFAGFSLNSKKLCTVRLSRKLIPNQPSYSLGKLCKAVNIPLNNRHRAQGDADATSILFNKLLNADQEGIIASMLKKNSKEQILPPHLDSVKLAQIPHAPGVYYFKDNKGKIIYVGKAVNLRKRVQGHFTGNKPNKQRQEFLKKIFHIDYEVCATELMALIFEAEEIKRLWPENNRAMKRYEYKYDLYVFEDQKGYLRLAIDKHKKNNNAYKSFNNLLEGYNFLNKLVDDFSLCARLCYLQKSMNKCSAHENGECFGACSGIETVSVYNKKINSALSSLRASQPSFALIDEGRTENEYSCIVVEHGVFYGMGYLNNFENSNTNFNEIKKLVVQYPSNQYIVNLIITHANQFPEKLFFLN